MSKRTLIRGARQLLTLHGPGSPRRGEAMNNLGMIQDGAILIEDGVISEVGSTRRVENLATARGADEIDATGRVVLPGFVDSHTHLVGGPPQFAEPEGTPGILALARAIQGHSSRTLEIQAVQALEEAVRHGTTLLEAKSGSGVIETGEIKILRIYSALQKMFLPVIATFLAAQIPPDYADRPDQFVERLCTYALPAIRRRKLARFADIHCDDGAFSISQSRKYLATARDLGLGLKVHAGARVPPGCVQMAVECGVVSIDHLTRVEDPDIRALAASPAIATLLPGCQFVSGAHQYPAGRSLIDGGVAVALASDYNAPGSPSQSMLMVIALACRHMNLTPAEAITATTINAAHAISVADRVGSLEKGKFADVVVLGVPDYREIPYHFGVNLVDMVMKRGRVVARRSEVEWPAL